jgi:hypothetical protein
MNKKRNGRALEGNRETKDVNIGVSAERIRKQQHGNHWRNSWKPRAMVSLKSSSMNKKRNANTVRKL